MLRRYLLGLLADFPREAHHLLDQRVLVSCELRDDLRLPEFRVLPHDLGHVEPRPPGVVLRELLKLREGFRLGCVFRYKTMLLLPEQIAEEVLRL